MTQWLNYNPTWNGRVPGLFRPENVAVDNGVLTLSAALYNVTDPALRKMGYGNFSTASVQSTAELLYGYFEVCLFEPPRQARFPTPLHPIPPFLVFIRFAPNSSLHFFPGTNSHPNIRFARGLDQAACQAPSGSTITSTGRGRRLT